MFRIFLAFLSHLSHCDESTDLWTGWCFKRCFRRCFAKKILRSSRSNNFDQTLDPNIHINESAAWIWDAKKCLPKRMVRLESTKVFGSQPAAETMAMATDLHSLVTLVLQRAMQIYAVDQQRNLEPLLYICMHLYSCQLLKLRSVFTALLTHCLNISFRTMGCRFSSMTSVKVNLPNSPPLRLASLGMTWSRYKKRIDKSSVSSRSMVPLSKRL